MAKRQVSDDIIPNEADYQNRLAEMKEWQQTHTDPRHKYVATYTLMGTKRSEDVFALNAEEAEKHVKAQWAMLGIYFTDLEIKEAANG